MKVILICLFLFVSSADAQMNMPGMAPAKANSKHTKDGIYEAPVNFAMAGTWDITVSVQRPGQKAAQEKFTITPK